jgi:hypothetical protein
VVAIVGIATIGLGASHLQKRWLARRLAAMRAAARADEASEPVLEIAPRLKGVRRILKPRRRILSVRLDETGIAIHRETGVSRLLWTDVKRWDRAGLVEWTLWDPAGRFALALKPEHGFTEKQLERIDNRVALHTADRPRGTLRERFASVKGIRNLVDRLPAPSLPAPAAVKAEQESARVDDPVARSDVDCRDDDRSATIEAMGRRVSTSTDRKLHAAHGEADQAVHWADSRRPREEAGQPDPARGDQPPDPM